MNHHRMMIKPLLAALALAAAFPAAAQDAQSLPQPSQGGAAAAFRLGQIRLSGAQSLPEAELQTLAAPYIGRDVTLADLETLADKLTVLYRSRGYFLAQAVVPMQTVRDGVVEISIIEGRLGNLALNIDPATPFSEARARAILSPLQAGQPLNGPQYERAMLLLSDQPGIRAGSALQAGVQAGTTDMTVEIQSARRWSFSADADNYGTRETGRYRAGGSARWASPTGIGDALDARLMLSNSGGLALGRLSYEAPLGSAGWRAGIGISHVQYQLGGAFGALDAHGEADVADASLNYPVIRSRRHNFVVQMRTEYKKLHDQYGAVEFDGHKRVQGLGLGWNWELRDDVFGGGYWSSTATWYHGHLSLRDAQTVASDLPANGGRGAAGNFDKFSFQLSRLQALAPSHTLFLSLGGQWARKNLDASEQLALGGASAVRAYSSDEVLVDQGAIASVQWRYSLDGGLTPYLFYDAARGWPSRNRLPGETANIQNLRGGGLGLQWARSGDFNLNLTLAWGAGNRPAAREGSRNPRIYLQAQKAF